MSRTYEVGGERVSAEEYAVAWQVELVVSGTAEEEVTGEHYRLLSWREREARRAASAARQSCGVDLLRGRLSPRGDTV